MTASTIRPLLAALSLILFVLSGCSVLPPANPDHLSNQQRAEATQSWYLDAKLSLRDGNARHTAALSWKQHADQFEINLSGPFNQGSLTMIGDRNTVAVELSDGSRYTGRDADQLVEQLIGWPLPVKAMYWWVRGLPQPNQPYEWLDDPNQRTLLQQGWQIVYQQNQPATPWLPRKLKLSKPPYQAVTLIYSWGL